MLKMKKGLIVAVVAALFMALAACGKSTETSSPSGAEKEGKQKITVGTDAAFAPFEYMQKGKIVGFDADLLDAVMKEAGLDYELKNIGWDPLFASLQSKEIDMGISGITITDERKQSYDFSAPYFEATQVILVKQGSPVKNALDLKGKTIGVQNATTGQEAAEKLFGKGDHIKKFETSVVAIMELLNGGVDAVITDNAVANEYMKNNPDKKLQVIEDPQNFASEYYGMIFPKESELKAKVDEALQKVIDSGKYADIYKKWFGKEPNMEGLKQQQ
ncbi:basic amino acid ABC transporter substrate-binding protein [Geobacillus stearothermophilus]|uniref:basic amino acid ABC transporter substrate-binding protein n=1 Tax=Geobacillus stearothermophilus TaxID=1422 RepID=UPI002E1F9168|nr:basic amino acid ABC transporter substrate-binding protein [Geobacillus stearothermophilus]MED3730841.1 basic amino acid ABC transporter substrate-binding protein [Geobacillus stearothermophilus]MED3733303.1 basic amino acid ABC transporter substrate-binding protein [Geobacillus stearothermophilus]MED3741459.1 basic amino acid ABC transporter substrate-binding protein [Geobacillus stearothermophilus]MED3750889.1 basic amino acid ABC transporter substrate-binding protein [Geobacillus stearoth